MEKSKIEIDAVVTDEAVGKGDDGSDCCICYQTLHNSMTCPCGHKFCFHCILDWTSTKHELHLTKTCPICQESVEGIVSFIEVEFVFGYDYEELDLEFIRYE
jgi:hypothetical protein